MEGLIFVTWVLLLAVLLGVALWQFRKRQARVLLDEIPPGVRLGERDESEAARNFWAHFADFLADFDQRAHPYQYRQIIDLMACGPRHLSLECANHLAQSRQLGVYASDLELRNELAEITVHLLRDSADRAERGRLIQLLDWLADFGEHHADALRVWFAPLVGDLRGGDARRRFHAVFVLAKLGTDEQRETARHAASDAALIAEYRAGRGEMADDDSTLPALPPAGDLLPCFADVFAGKAADEAEAHASPEPESGAASTATDEKI